MNTLKLYLKPDKKRVDLLACCLYNNDDFKFIAEMVKQQTGLELTASDDLTGNLKNNADWILESHDVNVKDVYFNDYINNYNFTFNKGGSIGGFGAYNNIINPFVEPFEQAVQVAEKFDFDFLNDLDIGIGVLETIADIIPGWLESILDFFFNLLPFNSIIEMILDEIPLPSIPMGGLLDIFTEMFEPIENLDVLQQALDYINIFDGHDNDYNIAKPSSTTQNMYAQTVTDNKVFFVDNNRYELPVFTGTGAMKSNGSGYCNHSSCTGRSWCVNVTGE